MSHGSKFHCNDTFISVLAAEQPGSYDHVIVNDYVDEAYDQLRKIVIDVSIMRSVMHFVCSPGLK